MLQFTAMVAHGAPSSIVVLGDINLDIASEVRALPQAGEDCLSPRLELHCGGVAANAAVALVRWGAEARLVGCVGKDPFGEHALGWLQRQGVDLTGVVGLDGHMTGVMYIVVTEDGQRTIFGSRGANAALQLATNAQQLMRGARGLYLVGYSLLSGSGAEAVAALLAAAREAGIQVSLDAGLTPCQQVPERVLQLARKVDILFVGSQEAAALTGCDGQADAFPALHEAGIREMVMKAGSDGCLYESQGKLHHVPAIGVHTVDTTGAGDAFAAAYLRARLNGWPQAEACLVANAAGAASASVAGAGDSMPRPAEIGRLLRGSRLPGNWDALRLSVVKRLREEFDSQIAIV